jgi:hypothetical protein
MRRRTVIWLLGTTATLVALFAAVELWKHLDRPGRATIRGTVVAGQRFVESFGPGFRLVLNPAEHGWRIDVSEGKDPRSLTAFTTPLRGPNACDLEGWHLRNEDNTGPNESGPRNVNAPGLEREFVFLPAREIVAGIKGNVRRARAFGRGRLEVLEHELTDLAAGQRASFARIRFRVVLEWPPGYAADTKP